MGWLGEVGERVPLTRDEVSKLRVACNEFSKKTFEVEYLQWLYAIVGYQLYVDDYEPTIICIDLQVYTEKGKNWTIRYRYNMEQRVWVSWNKLLDAYKGANELLKKSMEDFLDYLMELEDLYICFITSTCGRRVKDGYKVLTAEGSYRVYMTTESEYI